MAARMNDAEAIMWAVESDPFLRTDFTNVTVLESAPDFDQLRAGLERAIDAFPPLRQRVARPPLGLAPPQWADDSDFDLTYHLRRLSLPPPGEQRQLLDLAAQLAAMPLDRARPLWELTVVEGLGGGRAAVLQRLGLSYRLMLLCTGWAGCGSSGACWSGPLRRPAATLTVRPRRRWWIPSSGVTRRSSPRCT